MSWASRAAANIFPLSREKDNLAIALREWRYTGDYNDLEAPIETCKLCDHPDIRYQFEIQNLHTAETLLVGSECINRFNIAATDEEGRTLDADGTRKKLAKDRRKLVDDARRRRLVKALVALAHADKEIMDAAAEDHADPKAEAARLRKLLLDAAVKHGRGRLEAAKARIADEDARHRRVNCLEGLVARLDRQIGQVDIDRQPRHVPNEEIDGRPAFEGKAVFGPN